jgi:hypothetical protein
MKIHLILLILLCLGISVNAQKIRTQEVNVKTIHYPQKFLPENFKTYQIIYNYPVGKMNISFDPVQVNAQYMALKRLKMVEQNADMIIKITMNSVILIDNGVRTSIQDNYEPRTQKTTKVTYYAYAINYRMPIQYEVMDAQGRLMAKKIVYGIEPRYYATEESTVLADVSNTNAQDVLQNIFNKGITSIGWDLQMLYDFTNVSRVVNKIRLKAEKGQDLSEFEKHSSFLEELFKTALFAPPYESIQNVLKPNIEFWEKQAQNHSPDKSEEESIYFASVFNLALLYALIEDFDNAYKYIELTQKTEKREGYTSLLKGFVTSKKANKENYEQAKLKYQENPNSLFESEFQTQNTELKEELQDKYIQKGYVVIAPNDTLFGEVLDFDVNLTKNQIAIVEKNQAKKIFSLRDFKSMSVDGFIFEVINNRLLTVIHSSPFLKVYLDRQTKNLVFNFLKTYQIKNYLPYDPNDSYSYITNYKKKLGEVFESCDFVKQKALKGEYELKTKEIGGIVKAIIDYETNCGSKDPQLFEDTLDREKVKATYH